MAASLAQRLGTLYRALASKIFLLVVIFLVVPIILYQLFQTSDARQVALLERTVEEKGTLIASVVKPHLLQFQTETPDQLASGLAGVAQFHRREMAEWFAMIDAAGVIAELPGAALNADAQDQARQHGVVPFAGR